jgi:pimeloyl-ACP methyl ester carboxylesterase
MTEFLSYRPAAASTQVLPPPNGSEAGGPCLRAGYAHPPPGPTGQHGCRYRSGWLSLTSGASHYVDAAGEAAFRRLMPTVAFETLAGAGHWLHAEQPRPFLEAVQGFLGD